MAQARGAARMEATAGRVPAGKAASDGRRRRWRGRGPGVPPELVARRPPLARLWRPGKYIYSSPSSQAKKQERKESAPFTSPPPPHSRRAYTSGHASRRVSLLRVQWPSRNNGRRCWRNQKNGRGAYCISIEKNSHEHEPTFVAWTLSASPRTSTPRIPTRKFNAAAHDSPIPHTPTG